MTDERAAAGEGIEEPHGTEGTSAGGTTTDWKAEARKWEDRAKANRQAKDELDRLRESSAAAIAEAEAKAEAAQKEASDLKAAKERADMVSRVSAATGVPAEVVSRFSATDEESLSEAANLIRTSMHAYPSTNDSGETKQPPAVTKQDILAMTDARERRAAIAQHLELFNRQ